MRIAVKRMRAGWTLIELLVVFPLLVILLSGSAILLTALFRSQGSLSSDLQSQTSRARLAVQLRNDAHAASRVQCESPKSCGFTLPGEETVRYEIQETALHRELRRGDVVLEREKFPLMGLEGTFSLDKSLERPLICLSLVSTPEVRKYSVVARPSLLEAAVGISRTLSSEQGEKP